MMVGHHAVRRVSKKSEVLFPIWHVMNKAALCWKASRMEVAGGATFFRPLTADVEEGQEWPFELVTVVKESEWECTRLHWCAEGEPKVSPKKINFFLLRGAQRMPFTKFVGVGAAGHGG